MTTPTPASGSPLLTMSTTTPTVLWNDSSTPAGLAAAIGRGAMGATCNPVIALAAVRADPPRWQARVVELDAERPTATESEIGWAVVTEVLLEVARLLLPIFEEHRGCNGRLSMQTDPRLRRDAAALVAQAQHFSSLAPNVIVKMPATSVGLHAIEEATYRGVSINVTVSFSVSQAVAAGEAIERGPARRDVEGADTASMGPVVTIMVGRLDDWLKAVVAREHLDVEPIPWKGRGGRLQAVGGTVRRARSASPAAGRRLPQFQWTGLVGDDVVLSPPFA